MVIGITGGVGSGKSAVLKILKKEYNGYLLEADRIAHELMEPGQSCYQQIVDAFGSEVLDNAGKIDRKRLGDIAFKDRILLERLQAIIHPSVKLFIREKIENLKRETPDRLIAIEAALLIEDRYDEICDELWYIHADEKVRRQRLKENRGYTEDKIDSILKNQLSEQEFRRGCQKVVENSNDMEKTREEIKKALEL